MFVKAVNPGQDIPKYMKSREAADAAIGDFVYYTSGKELRIEDSQFLIYQGGVKRLLTNPDMPEKALTDFSIVIIRANRKARAYHAPNLIMANWSKLRVVQSIRSTCFSKDGIRPSSYRGDAPQATTCKICSNSDCQTVATLVIALPEKLNDLIFMDLDGSTFFQVELSASSIQKSNIPYNSAIWRIRVVPESNDQIRLSATELVMSDEDYARVQILHSSEGVKKSLGISLEVDDEVLESEDDTDRKAYMREFMAQKREKQATLVRLCNELRSENDKIRGTNRMEFERSHAARWQDEKKRREDAMRARLGRRLADDERKAIAAQLWEDVQGELDALAEFVREELCKPLRSRSREGFQFTVGTAVNRDENLA